MKIRRIGRLSTVVLIIGGLLAGAHMAATLAFTGPQTPLKDSLQPELNKYFLGPLDQGWSLFAPGVYSQDEYFLMRGCLSSETVCAKGASGGAVFSDWQNVTEQEMESARFNIFSNRGTKQSKVVNARFWMAADKLSSEQSKMAQGNHIAGQPVFGVDLNSPAAAEKYGAADLNTLMNYQRLEDVAVGFASLKALELWGGKASLVEVRMRRDPVVPFEQRNDAVDKPESSFIYIGWRDVMKFDDSAMAAWK
ncbi:DUF5819 family protein [Arthrobacter sp. ERGS1:01]|uniref:DUF5819 family protein n=1 Tax=Arthrobacter sp. ERGS1:01 TaxID=1704044 RepID=UPI000B175BEC|nr:DUF5819 family protein [Arthrobacter sp. ERGS1:01]